MKDYLVVYHKEDNDGVMSCALAVKFIKMQNKTYDLLGVNYNDLAKLWDACTVQHWHENYENLIMTDISFGDPRIMKTLKENFGNRFSWVDHHAPIIKESFKHGFSDLNGVRDTAKSAILCMYQYLYDPFNECYNEKSCPELLVILSAWDSFSYEREGYELRYVQAVNMGVNFSYNLNVERMLDLLDYIMMERDGKYYDALSIEDSLIHELWLSGATILEYNNSVYAQLMENNAEHDWTVGPDNRPASVLFMQGASNSTMFATVKDKSKNGIVVKRTHDGHWGLSLYNTNTDDTFHCGEYLKKKYKGGGHVGAAGCLLTDRQFNKMLKTKHL